MKKKNWLAPYIERREAPAQAKARSTRFLKALAERVKWSAIGLARSEETHKACPKSLWWIQQVRDEHDCLVISYRRHQEYHAERTANKDW